MDNRDLIHRYLLGKHDDEVIKNLNDAIVQDDEFRRQFVREIVLDAALREGAGESIDSYESAATHAVEREHDNRLATRAWPTNRFRIASLLALAAGLLLMVGWLLPATSRPSASVATLVSSEGASWVSDLPTTIGSSLSPGVVELVTGIATLEFDSGAIVLLEAPASLEIISDMQVRLIDGSAIVDAPETAIGFIVSTDCGDATDLGTRFGVTVDAESKSTEFEVFDGEVSVNSRSLKDPIRLKTSDAIRLDEGGSSTRLSDEPDRKPTNETVDSNVVRVDTNELAATFIRGNNFRGSRYPELLMVKSSWKNNNYDRKSVFTIDASEANPQNFEAVRLRLNQVTSPIGFASRLPTMNVFEVYGIASADALQWSGKSTWQDAPSPEDGVLVAEFEIPRSQSSGECLIESERLDQFVRSNIDKPMTFVLVRKTRTIKGTERALIHAFASPSHPTRKGPTLEFVCAE